MGRNEKGRKEDMPFSQASYRVMLKCLQEALRVPSLEVYTQQSRKDYS